MKYSVTVFECACVGCMCLGSLKMVGGHSMDTLGLDELASQCSALLYKLSGFKTQQDPINFVPHEILSHGMSL